jgi:hypothetical protein
MTSQVMETPRARGYLSGMNNKILLPLLGFVLFGGYTLWVMSQDGVLGFLPLAGREPWALQMLLDLFIMLGLFAVWLVPDARALGLNPWPYVLLTLTMGSPGALFYLVRRGFRAYSPARPAARA